MGHLLIWTNITFKETKQNYVYGAAIDKWNKNIFNAPFAIFLNANEKHGDVDYTFSHTMITAAL